MNSRAIPEKSPPNRRRRAVLAGAGAAVVGTALAVAAIPASAATAGVIVQGESLSLNTKFGKVYTDKTASGGKALTIWQNATATGAVTTAGKMTSLTINAMGSVCGSTDAAPRMKVTIDGKTVAANTTVKATKWTGYTVNGSWAAGKHTVGVSFLNEYGTSKCDRYLMIDKITATYTKPNVSIPTPVKPSPTKPTPTPTKPAPTTPPTTTPTKPPATTPPTTTKPPTTTPTTPPATTGSAPALHVSGNKILTSAGKTYQLMGVNRSGSEYLCIRGDGIWEGPMDQAQINIMKSWGITAVRVPLNEACWLGTTTPAAWSSMTGTAYQNTINSYVNLLITNGITPIVDLHWTYGKAPGAGAQCTDEGAVCQKPLPDAKYAPTFWTSVANKFKDRPAVVFELFNEPYPDRVMSDYDAAWACWRDGGTCDGMNYEVAGMQTLLNAVRATGAKNVTLVNGLGYANDTWGLLKYAPKDSTGNLAAAAHPYNFAPCATTSCWNDTYAPVAAKMPLTFTEFGEINCANAFSASLLNWADTKGIGYTGWTWNTWECAGQPVVITDYNGTPSAAGAVLKQHLLAYKAKNA